VTKATKAIIAVHIFGHRRTWTRSWTSAGSTGYPSWKTAPRPTGPCIAPDLGSIGAASRSVFFPTKPLGGAGDGGMVCTSDGELAAAVKCSAPTVEEEIHPRRTRDEQQARRDAGRSPARETPQARRVDRIEKAHRRGLRRDAARGRGTLHRTGRVSHVYHQYTVRTPERGQAAEGAIEQGVGCTVYYPVPIHLPALLRIAGLC